MLKNFNIAGDKYDIHSVSCIVRSNFEFKILK